MISRLSLPVILHTNALTSALTGILMAALAAQLAELTGLSSSLVRVAGLGLLPFAVAVERVARDPRPGLVRLVSAADFTWVVASVVVVVREPVSMLGAALVLAIAAVVEVFGMLQLLRLSSTRRMLTPS